MLSLAVAVFVFRPAGRMAGHAAAIEVTSRDAQSAHMPDGFFGVRLLDSPSTLQRVRPNTQKTPYGWMEMAEWKGTMFRVLYDFDAQEKYVLMITLQRPSNDNQYRQIQAQLNEEFGPLSTPSQEEEKLLYSERSAGGVVLFHSLYVNPNDVLIEQVVLYKAAGA
jgi:hypothetical protein